MAHGTFTGGGIDAHSWAEYWDDADGWVTVDPSLQNALDRWPIPGNHKFAYFNFWPTDRLCFSYDTDIVLPGVEGARDGASYHMVINGQAFAWGTLAADGVPYLQPFYPLFDASTDTAALTAIWMTTRGRSFRAAGITRRAVSVLTRTMAATGFMTLLPWHGASRFFLGLASLGQLFLLWLATGFRITAHDARRSEIVLFLLAMLIALIVIIRYVGLPH